MACSLSLKWHLEPSLNAYSATADAKNAFVIAPDGRIALVFDAVKPSVHSAEVLSALKDLEKK